MDYLTNDNKRLIYYIINRYIISKIGYKYEIEDLFQVGVIGLIKAYNNYQDGSNAKFSSYAYNWILGEIIKYIKINNSLKVSVGLIALNKSINHAREFLTQKLHKEPSIKELAFYLKINEEEIMEAIMASETVESLDSKLEEDFTLYDSIKVEEKSYQEELMDLKLALSKLPPLEKKLIIDRYFNDLTQNEVSRQLGISQVQVSRAEKKVLIKLKDKLVA